MKTSLIRDKVSAVAVFFSKRLARGSKIWALGAAGVFLIVSICSNAQMSSDFDSEFLRQADPAGEFRMARFYLMEGTHQDLRRAFIWALRAAEMGNAEAQFTVGTFYYAGKGVTESRAKALTWFRKAAEQGHVRGQLNTANLLASGDGVPADPREAFTWYQKAANQGHPQAQQNLGAMFFAGKVVEKNLPEAYKWLSLAAEAGIDPARNATNHIAGQMTILEMAHARRLVDSFRKQRLPDEAKTLAILPVQIRGCQATNPSMVNVEDLIEIRAFKLPSDRQIISAEAFDYASRALRIPVRDMSDKRNAGSMATFLNASSVISGEAECNEGRWTCHVRLLDLARSKETSATFTAHTISEFGERLTKMVVPGGPADALVESNRIERLCPGVTEGLIATRTEFRKSPSYSQIETSARKLLAISPECPQALLALAVGLGGQGKLHQAAMALTNVIRVEPHSGRVYRHLGTIALRNDELVEAEHLLQKAQVQDARDIETLIRLSELYAVQRAWAPALFFLEEARTMDPFRADVYAKLAFIHSKKGDRSVALAAAAEAEALISDKMDEHQMLFSLYDSLGDPSRALHHYKQFLELAERSGLGHELIAPVKKEAEQMQAKLVPTLVKKPDVTRYTERELWHKLTNHLASEETLLVQNPLISNEEMGRYTRELVGSAQDDMEKARVIFEALRRGVNDGQASTLTAIEAFQNKGFYRRCQEQARLFVALARSIGLQAYVVNVERDCFDRQVIHQCSGLVIGENALLIDPSYSWFGVPHKKFRFLDDFEATGSFLSQFEDLEHRRIAAKLLPNDPWVLFAYLYAAIAVEKWEQAVRIAADVRRIDSGSWMALVADASFARHSGDFSSALKLLSRASEMNPDESEIDLQTAHVFVQMNRFAQARDRYQQAIRKAAGPTVAEKATRAITGLSRLPQPSGSAF